MSDERYLKPATLDEQDQQEAVSVKDGGRGGETGYVEGRVEGGINRDAKEADDAEQELRAGGEATGDGGSQTEQGAERLNIIFHDPYSRSAQLPVLIVEPKALEQFVFTYKGADAGKAQKSPAGTQEAEIQVATEGTEKEATVEGRHIPQAAGDSQERRGASVGTFNDFFRNLPNPIKRRLGALKKLQTEVAKIESEYHKAIHDTERKYACLYQPLFDKRYKIINAICELTDDKNKWNPGANVAVAEEVKEKTKLEGKTSESKDYPKGIPHFWVQVFKNAELLRNVVQKHDEPILEHMKDIRLKFSDAGEPMSFTVEFLFEPNEYFSNEVLTKTYVMRSDPNPADPFFYHGPQVIGCIGCEIHWKKRKDDLWRCIEQQESKGNETSGTVYGTSNNSFFNYFSTPEIPEFGMPSMDAKAKILEDLRLGFFFREYLVPRSVLYLAGQGN